MRHCFSRIDGNDRGVTAQYWIYTIHTSLCLYTPPSLYIPTLSFYTSQLTTAFSHFSLCFYFFVPHSTSSTVPLYTCLPLSTLLYLRVPLKHTRTSQTLHTHLYFSPHLLYLSIPLPLSSYLPLSLYFFAPISTTYTSLYSLHFFLLFTFLSSLNSSPYTCLYYLHFSLLFALISTLYTYLYPLHFSLLFTRLLTLLSTLYTSTYTSTYTYLYSLHF